MKKTKKLLASFMVLTLLFNAVGCGSAASSKEGGGGYQLQ